MGIKGVYGEIGVGERIALSKLAIEKYEQTGRPLRIAIDVAIWQFQILSGRGGSDPATRTLYYRLLRLLASSVQPLFIFDGPNKPPFKRNKRTGSNGGSVSNLLTKKLLKYFGFPYHYAPGEAEAECALLQQNGIVDAVLSEDVDTLMFGSDLCLRNWSSEGCRGNKAPTHISAYYKRSILDKSGLDREGMILVALMSGGDYNTEGIPGCGIKLAFEAARAGFGKSLCAIARSDTSGYKSWRENLSYEISTNKSGFFKTKRKILKIPENFPDRDILGYYTHPVVSSASKIEKLKEEIQWSGLVDVPGLRQFVADAFEWKYKAGAIKFIRSLAPALLVHKLRIYGEARSSEFEDILLKAMNETEIVRTICGKRTHFSTDGMDELRLIYHPLDIVGLDLDAEEEESSKDFGRNGLAPRNAEGCIDEYLSNVDDGSEDLAKSTPTTYDPTQPSKIWVARTIARIGVPLKVEDYEESFRNPEKFLKAKAKSRRAMLKRGTLNTIVNKDIKTSKPEITSRAPISNKNVHAILENNVGSDSNADFAMNTLKAPRDSVSKTKISIISDLPSKAEVKVISTGKARSKTNTKPLNFRRITKPVSQTNNQYEPRAKAIKPPSPVQSRAPSSLDSPQSTFKHFNSRIPHHPLSIDDKTNNYPVQRKLKIKSTDAEISGKNASSKKKLSSKPFNPNIFDRKFNEFSTPQPLGNKTVTRMLSPDFLEISNKSLTRKGNAKNDPTQTYLSCQYPIDLTCSPDPVALSSNHAKNQYSKNARLKSPDERVEILINQVEQKNRASLSTICSHYASPSSQKTQKKSIVLRDSLPGTWKLVDGFTDNCVVTQTSCRVSKKSGKEVSTRWRMSEIEFLDMTAD